MTFIPEFVLPRDDEEGLFSRDIDGQLVRLDKATEDDYERVVTVQVDGKSIQVPIAEPLKDAQGNIVLDIRSRTTPRYTTILDAVTKLNATRKEGETQVSIPTLCHQSHMTPVAVCRLCVVQVWGKRKGERERERKLLPACQHQVKDGMEVFTMQAAGPDGDRVRRAVCMMTELLMADHLKPAPAPAPADELAPFNELQQMADLCGLKHSRFELEVLAKGFAPLFEAKPPRGRRTLDSSSPVFLIDHSACIQCNRCIRACNEVKNNHVIGRTGKGRTAGIGFDLNDEMFESHCVQCGECMVSCPTSAITFKPAGEVAAATDRVDKVVPMAELIRDPLFAGVPPKFLLWQKDLVRRRHLNHGDFVCRKGEPGHSAFIIRRGVLLVGQLGAEPISRTTADVIVGEMACLSSSPRNADIYAGGDAEVWEVRRNVLDRIMRSPTQRVLFEQRYRDRALSTALLASEVFFDLAPEEYAACVEFLRPRLEFVRVSPGQTILRQDDQADNMYLILLGHVRVGISRYGQESRVFYRGPGTVIGEIGLLSVSEEDADKSVEEVYRILRPKLANANAIGLPPGRRNATCLALDHVELARIDRSVFLDLARQFPTFLRNVVRVALNRLKEPDTPLMRKFVEQGLYQGQSLLALDLTKCTRCDECTKACIRQHGTASHGHPLTRLLRDGLRFGDLLVATACRSCKDAYCMIGCPVDAIHRGRHQQIVIEDNCIGCGLCARNCPYGNIFMEPNMRDPIVADDPTRPGQTHLLARPKAATCDLCDADGREDRPTPRCVYACPHDAAHRMTGNELLKLVREALAETQGNGEIFYATTR